MKIEGEIRGKKLLLVNANIHTMDNSFPRARWIAIEDGIIKSIGNLENYNAFNKKNNFEIVDCKGLTVLPGFIDAHLHLRAFAEGCVTIDLSWFYGIKCLEDIQNVIRARCERMPRGSWIRGRGYNEFYLLGKRHPNRLDLDEVAPVHPVKITHRSGHAHVLNTAALEIVGITKETGDPPGGLIDRDLFTGEPTGLLYEMGKFLSKRIPPLHEKELLEGLEIANRRLLASGITSVEDASYLNDLTRWQEIISWKQNNILQPRINFMLGQKGFEEFKNDPLNFKSVVPENQLRARGIKIILDETTGNLLPTQHELNEVVYNAHRSGFQVSIHAIEERAIESAYKAIKWALSKLPVSDHRHRIEHCSVCRPSLLNRLASAGIVVVTQPSFIFYNGDRYLETVCDKDLKHLYPIRSLLKAGIPVAGSSDCPIVPPNPLTGIYSALTRKSITGKLIVPSQKISCTDALCLYTNHAAKASFEENMKGSITPGKLADLVVLSEDPTAVPEDEIRDIEVEMTILDGKVAWRKNN